jgi:exonuclease III
MSQDEHIIQLEEALKTVNYDIIGLCEVKKEDETILERPNFILYTNTITRKRGSVGLLVKKKFKDEIEHFKSKSDRVCYVTIRLKEGSVSIIQAYAPHSGRPE